MSPEPLKGDRLIRPPIDVICENISLLSDQTLSDAIKKRFHREWDDVLPGMGRDEDPSDIFIDCYKRNPEKLSVLKSICTLLTVDAAKKSLAEIESEPGYVSELIYMAAMIGANESIPAVAEISRRKELSKIIIGRGEDLQSLALRCLSTLLTDEPMTIKDKYRDCLEQALEEPAHADIALSALSEFWPNDKERFISRASRHESASLNRVVENIDDLLGPE